MCPNIVPGALQRWLRAAERATGIDFHVLVTLLLRGWNILAGGIMILLVPLWLDKIEQGYYYTFSSILALSIFFELGFNQVVTQIVGHEFAHLAITGDARVTGPERRVARLASVVKLLTGWYAVASILFLVVVGPLGGLFFHRNDHLPDGEWQFVWWMLVLATAANLFLSPQLAVIEGMGRVGQVARLRLAQSMVGYGILWIGFAAGLGLWMVPAIPAAAALCTLFWLSRAGHPLPWLRRQSTSDPADRVSWRTEIFPFQWRIAVSWISGYFILQCFTPLVFKNQGAAAAGQLGIALSMYGAIMTLGLSWINAKLPVFIGLIARHERSALNALFSQVAVRSIGFTAIACLLVLAVVAVLGELRPNTVQRIAGLPTLTCLAVITVVNTATAAMATYMRAHREEPMLPVSVVAAILTASSAFVASRVGMFEMMLAYAAVVALVATPWTASLFSGYYRRSFG